MAVERDGVDVDGEVLVTDADEDVPGDPAAGDAVAIGDNHLGTRTVVEVQAQAAAGRRADEVVRRSGV
jgi:hypothetical protein